MTKPARILIVDDEPNVRLVFRTALETKGYLLDEAADGDQAVERIMVAKPDLILLDLKMPVLDGMGTLHRLREMGLNVPVVIITAHGSVPDAVAALRLGAIDFLSKPLTPDALRDVVFEVLSRHAEPMARSEVSVPKELMLTVENQFHENLERAKQALNNRWFDEAEVFLKQATGLKQTSAEAHNLLGVLREVRNEHDASYRSYKAALKADKHYEPAKHNMRRYYERCTFGQSDVPIDLGEDS